AAAVHASLPRREAHRGGARAPARAHREVEGGQMSTLLDMLIPAAGASVLALACLALLPRAPAELRFWIASAGLVAWAIPWPLLRWTLPLSAVQPSWTVLRLGGTGTALSDLTAAKGVGAGFSAPVLPWVVGALFAIGASWLIVDCVRMRAVL